jgi:uncharacterized protein Usg
MFNDVSMKTKEQLLELWNDYDKCPDFKPVLIEFIDEVESLKNDLWQQRFNNKHNLSIDQKISDEIMRLKAENEELKEYKFKYEGLCK